MTNETRRSPFSIVLILALAAIVSAVAACSSPPPVPPLDLNRYGGLILEVCDRHDQLVDRIAPSPDVPDLEMQRRVWKRSTEILRTTVLESKAEAQIRNPSRE